MLLIYIMAALVWWFISLNRQNTGMRDFAISNLRSRVDSSAIPAQYQAASEKIEKKYRTNKAKYIGEGSIFFLLLLFGASFVYRSVRRQFRLQLQQQNFMMAVTHELKTPISVARLNLKLCRNTISIRKNRKN
jgi:signal transduction histidine kinase